MIMSVVLLVAGLALFAVTRSVIGNIGHAEMSALNKLGVYGGLFLALSGVCLSGTCGLALFSASRPATTPNNPTNADGSSAPTRTSSAQSEPQGR